MAVRAQDARIHGPRGPFDYLDIPDWIGFGPERASPSPARGRPRRADPSGPLKLWVAEPPEASSALARRVASLGRDSLQRNSLVAADLIATVLAIALALGLVGGLQPGLKILSLVPVVPLLAIAFGLYDRDGLVLRAATLDEVPGIFAVATLFGVAVWLMDRTFLAAHITKPEFLSLWLGLIVLLMVGRTTARAIVGRVAPPERCLLLSGSRSFARLRKSLQLGSRSAADAVAGAWLDPAGVRQLLDRQLDELIAKHHIERVVVAPGDLEAEAVVAIVREAERSGVKVSILPGFSELLGAAIICEELSVGPMLAVRQFELGRSRRALKRAFDVVGSLLIVILTLPLLIAIAIAIKATSPGPVLFRQSRVGRGGRTFQIFKFRSMVDEADDLKTRLVDRNEAEGLFKISADPRVTRVGRWLRRSSLDELPQLINVLRGEMSLVGPRPLIRDEDRHIAGWYRRRLDLPPGMTGHWQVLGSARVPLDEMVVIDYLYIANWSLWGDIKCLLRTVPCVVGRRGM
ncbi:MAG: exopolysaccharide biosynthesis polyprenyl glycosylphosphotransferase [Solirubrobacterales bacterium]